MNNPKITLPNLCTFSLCGVLVGIFLTLLYLKIGGPLPALLKKDSFTQRKRLAAVRKVSAQTRSLRARARQNLKRRTR